MTLAPGTLQICVEEATAVLRKGGVILYPTDTLYGLGADALSDEAVAKIYALKGRDENKPVHAIVSDLNMMEIYGAVSASAKHLAERFLPGPLTLVLAKRPEFNSGITKDMDTIGMRVPNNAFCIRLAQVFGRPFTTTSANKSGTRPRSSVKSILSNMGAAAALIDLVIDAGELPDVKPSTVVDVSGAEVVVLRAGEIPTAEILSSAL